MKSARFPLHTALLLPLLLLTFRLSAHPIDTPYQDRALKTETGRLAFLANWWGWMKYYHPALSSGRHDADSLLVSLIPEAQKAPSGAELEEVLQQALTGLGPLVPCASCRPPADKVVQANISVEEMGQWPVSDSFARRSQEVVYSLRPDSSVLVTDRYQVYRLDHARFTENPFREPAFPAEPYRLLALFRYWNAIRFFYPHYPDLPVKWQQVLEEQIPHFQAAVY